ncbi:MAG: hypothetical protein H7Z72_21645 [Bacteroidetes bacterium]|nr:hypothetical protein [Fibrella sp.]
MQSFIAIQHSEKGPTFTTFDTIQAAKNHLQSLIVSKQVDANDALAIVRASDDSIIYFKQRNNTVASLNTALRQSTTSYNQSTQSIYQTVKERLTLVYTALTNVVSRR